MKIVSLLQVYLTHVSLLSFMSNAQSLEPSLQPSISPSFPPTAKASSVPSLSSSNPSVHPSLLPSTAPSSIPSKGTSLGPSLSAIPSTFPSLRHTSFSPSNAPTKEDNPKDSITNWATENKGAIIGIALGALAIIFVTVRRRRNLRKADEYYRPPPFPVQSEEPPEYGYDTRIDDSTVAVEVTHHGRAY